ncbi:hypothetical protein EU811_20805 [Arthrobacter sp. TS-15]|uniref:hypothetical protein n=1 Tax=Arthrobacter sp. TS-15 TaxID=2510797 RepID=UPI00115F734E|nr:hypothetical protein [Arthrobacter sp. TS-15]TQS88591.1 hypothetical protein EU811_20805 [Arthrobacter sp. TS-15]
MSYKIELVNGKAVLPTGGEPWNFAEWRDAEEKIRQFSKRAVGRRPRQGERIPVELALVHRPDNDYNSNAISIAAPAQYGGDREQRFFGYLYESQLRRIGMTRLADLSTALGGAELSCTGIATQDGLELDLPEPAELARAIDEFLGFDDTGTHTRPSPETDSALQTLQNFTAELTPVGELHLTTRYGRVGRLVEVRDRTSQRLLGNLDRGYLLLEDERDREVVLRLLVDGGIWAAKPLSEQPIPLERDWPRTRVPNLRMDARSEVYLFPPVSPMARFNPKTGKLWIEDSRLVGPALCYASRVGLKVTELGISRRPWKLTEDIPFDEFSQDARERQAEKRRDKAAGLMTHQIIASISTANLEHVLPAESIEVKHYEIAQGAIVEAKRQFQLHESLIQQRRQLFGEHTLADKEGSCRLCGQPAWPVLTSICTEPLTYCQQCLEFAGDGVFANRSRAAAALKLIAELEFSDEPMLEGQLETVHIDPRLPQQPDAIDKLLLLRFAIKRGKFPWTLLLEEAGLADAGLRLSRGTLIRARDGHRCLSMGEKAVCDFMHQFGIEHEREPTYPMDPVLNPLGRRRADWILADGTFVELWGLPNNPAYAAKMQEKRQLAERQGLALVELTERDLPTLPLAFAPWLPASTPGATTWKWSPIIKSVPVTPMESHRDGNALGLNTFNSDVRRERIERCRRAWELQSSGFTRREIAEALAVSADNVKALLRDAKFFADPASDEERLQRAGAAASAQRSGLTKEQFQAQSGLSGPKVNESWKDADIISPAR